MKIIGVDNFANEAVADLLVAENITNKSYADVMCNALNERYSGDHAARFYRVEEDSYILNRGAEESLE